MNDDTPAALVSGGRIQLPHVVFLCATISSGAAATSSIVLPASPSGAQHVEAASVSTGVSEPTPHGSFGGGDIANRGLLQPTPTDGSAAMRDAVKREVYALRPGAEALLAADRDLPFLLLELCVELRKVFGQGADIAVERSDDPEAPEEAPVLFALVRTRLDGSAAAEALDHFNDVWWVDNMDRARGKLEVSVEFV